MPRFDLVLATADSTSRNTCGSPAIRRIAENAVARSSSALATRAASLGVSTA